MSDILSLPPELLSRILDYVPGRDLPNVCITCKTLRDVVYVDSVWQRKCKQEYNFKSIEGWNVNYRTLYSKVLMRYGDLVGLWRRDFKYFGGLLQIKYDKGCIKGLEVLAPASLCVDRPLRKKDLFTISMTSSETVQIVSVHNFPEDEDGRGGEGEQRPCILRVEKDETKGRVLEYKVTDKNYILQKENLTDLPVFRRWISDEFEDDPNANMYFPCYRRRGVDYLSSRHEYRWSPLELPSKDRVNVPIQPGLFKGTYSAHGIEILSLDYNDDLTEVTVTKITGDPNVPATKVSVYGILTSPLVLTLEQQESLDTLAAVSAHHVTEQSGLPVRQPFRVPARFERDVPDIPEFCTFRCRADGQIAAHSFQNPSFSDGHFVVFDERKFGMVWLELMSFSIYVRVDEKELSD
ncbi:F-box only protein 31 isoform X1 [Magallana gigas]|uniref:F-box only protein 31 isoform X1 n=1 Tax=Magallana gigas TaxID=29159 RepID=UPI0033422143